MSEIENEDVGTPAPEQPVEPSPEPAGATPSEGADFGSEEYEAALAQAYQQAYQEGYGAALEQAQPTEAPTYGQQGYDEQEGFEPEFDDPELQAQLDQYVEAKLNERLGAIEPVMERMADQYGDQEVEQFLGWAEQQVGGSFDHDRAAAIAADMEEAGLDREQALYQAAQLEYQFEQDLMRKAADEYQASLRASQSAPAEPGITGAAGGPAATEPPDWDDIGPNWIGKRSPVEAGG